MRAYGSGLDNISLLVMLILEAPERAVLGAASHDIA